MRSIQVIEKSSDRMTRADHVIGIDESGNVTGSGPFTIAAVRCPRDTSERLVELLLENDLAPWQAKSQSITEVASPEQRTRRVRNLMEALTDESVSWYVAVGYSDLSIHHKAAAVCMLAKKTITSSSRFSGDAVLLPDGAPSMYGDRQRHLRTQAGQIFDGSFQSAFGGVYVTGLPKADLTYPEVTAADYIAGLVREVIADGASIDALPDQVIRFEQNWREPSVSPHPFYQIRGVSGGFGARERTRVAAWIKGRRPDGGDFDVSSQWETTVQMLESEPVQQYLLEAL